MGSPSKPRVGEKGKSDHAENVFSKSISVPAGRRGGTILDRHKIEDGDPPVGGEKRAHPTRYPVIRAAAATESVQQLSRGRRPDWPRAKWPWHSGAWPVLSTWATRSRK